MVLLPYPRHLAKVSGVRVSVLSWNRALGLGRGTWDAAAPTVNMGLGPISLAVLTIHALRMAFLEVHPADAQPVTLCCTQPPRYTLYRCRKRFSPCLHQTMPEPRLSLATVSGAVAVVLP